MGNKKDIYAPEGATLLGSPKISRSLLHDLGDLDDSIGKHELQQKPTSLAIIRLVPDMTLKEWNTLNAGAERQGWYAIEISPDKDQGITNSLLNYLADAPAPGYHIDPVSGALLEAAFTRQLEAETARARRGRYDLAIGVFSVDNLDGIYESHGPDAAREAIVNLILCLKQETEPCDSIGRLAGGEYALIMPGASIFKLQDTAERVHTFYREKIIESAAGSFKSTISSGLASGQVERYSGEVIMNNALDVMHQAVESGGDNIRVNRRDIRCFRENSVLVCSNEKRFLFSGTD